MTPQPRHIVKIGEGHVAGAPWRIETVLGSCLGVALVWREGGVYGVAHVVLPRRHQADDTRYTRYGDTAVPYLLRRMGVPEAKWRDVRAILVGGSEMYEGSHSHVGNDNYSAVRASLREHGIRVVGRDVGGRVPRRLVIDSANGTAESIHLNDDDTHSGEHTWKLVH